jgi:putative FmdB family regulatory protein
MPYPVPILAHALPFNVIVGGTYGKRNRTVLPGDPDLAHADCPSHSEYDRPPARRQISPLSCEQKGERVRSGNVCRHQRFWPLQQFQIGFLHSFIPINMCHEASPEWAMTWLLTSSAVCKLEEQGMPTYEFQCVKCRKRFELAYSVTEYERKAKKIKCPKCGSTRVGRQISAFEVKTSKKS